MSGRITALSTVVAATLAATACTDRKGVTDAVRLSVVAGAMDTILVGPPPGPPRELLQPQNPYADDPQMMQEGRRLFVAFNCSGCHGGHAGGGMGPSLRDERWMYGSSDAQIFDSIARGRAHGMPAWGTMLPRSEIWKLTAYIRSLRSDQEPDAPR